MHTNSSYPAGYKNNIASALLTVILASFLLTACDNNDSSRKTILSSNTTVRKYDQAVTLYGVVSSKEGSVTSGEISATNEKGIVIASTQLKDSDRYSIEIPAGTPLPILITVTPVTKQSDNQTLQVAVIDPTLKKYDISLLTTAIAKKARAMGGYTYINLRQAAMDSSSAPDANKTTGGFRGDPTRQYGGWH
jgi:hypothetical protein